jgi:molybdopterin/thiamine biosynthesis adenylyltransferase/rhodanese-related sulfurtransferase
MNTDLPSPGSSSLEVTVEEADRLKTAGAQVFDLRDDNERQLGTLREAVPVTQDDLVQHFASRSQPDATITLILCARGIRSRSAVEQLRRAGHGQVYSIAGGFNGWSRAGFPVDFALGLTSRETERYARHLVLPQVGAQGQKKLLEARVLLIGLGGLNSPAAMYLAAAGVGTLGLVDDDRVERSNLQRQILHSDESVGDTKTCSASQRLGAINPDIKLVTIDERVGESNVEKIISGWDIVIDGTDNFPSRYLVNDACNKSGIPLVYGAVMSFQGQVSVFWPAAGKSAKDIPSQSGFRPCYRCLFPRAPAPGEAPDCSVAGVLGVLPGIVGTLQASEALKLLLGIGSPLIGRLLMFDVLTMEFRETRVPSRSGCESCHQPAL